MQVKKVSNNVKIKSVMMKVKEVSNKINEGSK